MNLKRMHIIAPRVDEKTIDERVAYVISIKNLAKLEYREAMLCKDKDWFYFLPIDRFFMNIIPYNGLTTVKKVLRKDIEDCWKNNHDKILKKYKVEDLYAFQDYLYACIYYLENGDYEELSLRDFEEMCE